MHAVRVLEFESVKELLKRHCETVVGADYAGDLRASFVAEEVWRQLDTTAEAHDALSRHSVPSLGAVRDVRFALRRAKKGGVLGGQELYQLGECLQAMRVFRAFLSGLRESMPLLGPYSEALPDLPKLEDSLLGSLDGDGSLKDSASPALSTLRARKKSLTQRIQETIQSFTTGKTRDLLSDPIFTQRDGRYVVPLKAENRGKIRGIVHDTSSSGQTIYVEPEAVLQLGNALREAEGAERAEELRILTMLSAKAGAVADEVTGGIEASAHLDFVFAKARLAYEMKATMPQRASERSWISIQGGRHPLLNPEVVVPLDLTLGAGASVLITGPNTGGKTVAIKCVGLFVLMAQSGLFLPSLEVRLAPFSQIWADIGDEQSLEQSLSTFSGHLKNIAEALRGLKPGALVLFDEIGAGTDPAEGAALATELLRELSTRGAAILASTHYGELKAFAYNTPGFTNAAMEFDPKTLRPTYRLLMGSPGASQALRIAERYGIPKEIVERAREGLGQQQIDMADMMERLDLAQRQARIAQGEADRRAAELKKLESDAQNKLKEADAIRKNANARAQSAIEGALREIRLEAASLFEELKKASVDPQVQDKVRKGLRELDEVGTAFAGEFAPKKRAAGGPEFVVEKGMSVRVEGYTQIGTVMDDPRGNTVSVQLGALRMNVPLNSISKATKHSASVPQTNVQRPASALGKSISMGLSKAMNASTEVDLRHMRADEAKDHLDRFVDDALLAGLPSLRVVHGKGEGILRKMTQDSLKRNPNISEVRDGEPTEGGQGVTIAIFR